MPVLSKFDKNSTYRVKLVFLNNFGSVIISWWSSPGKWIYLQSKHTIIVTSIVDKQCKKCPTSVMKKTDLSSNMVNPNQPQCTTQICFFSCSALNIHVTEECTETELVISVTCITVLSFNFSWYFNIKIKLLISKE